MTHPQYPCPLGVCDKPCSLSDEAAVQIHEFMETMAANFLSCYGHQIQRHYARKINLKTAVTRRLPADFGVPKAEAAW